MYSKTKESFNFTPFNTTLSEYLEDMEKDETGYMVRAAAIMTNLELTKNTKVPSYWTWYELFAMKHSYLSTTLVSMYPQDVSIVTTLIYDNWKYGHLFRCWNNDIPYEIALKEWKELTNN